MRVAISGVEGAGKTSLAKAVGIQVRERLKREFFLVPEYTEEALQSLGMFPNFYLQYPNLIDQISWLRRNDPTNNFAWHRAMSEHKYAAEIAHEDTISDRPHIDGAAYVLMFLQDKIPDSILHAFVQESIRKSHERYDLIIYLEPPQWDRKDEGRRRTDIGYLTHLDAIMRGLYAQAGIELLQIPGNDIGVETRAKAVVRRMINGPLRRRD